jgi:hypothetical protein
MLLGPENNKQEAPHTDEIHVFPLWEYSITPPWGEPIHSQIHCDSNPAVTRYILDNIGYIQRTEKPNKNDDNA